LVQVEKEEPTLFLVSMNTIQMGFPFPVSVLKAAVGDAALITMISPLLRVAIEENLGLGVAEAP
jgi:hypothetical protein